MLNSDRDYLRKSNWQIIHINYVNSCAFSLACEGRAGIDQSLNIFFRIRSQHVVSNRHGKKNLRSKTLFLSNDKETIEQ